MLQKLLIPTSNMETKSTNEYLLWYQLYSEGKTVSEIAAEFGHPRSKVYNGITKAKKQIRRKDARV